MSQMKRDTYGREEYWDRFHRHHVGESARRVREAEEAQAAEAEAKKERARQAEAERLAAAQERSGPIVDAWPVLGPQLAQDVDDARARFVAQLRDDPAFAALLEWMSADYRYQQARRARGDAVADVRGRVAAVAPHVPRPFKFVDVIQQAILDAAGDMRFDARSASVAVLEESAAAPALPPAEDPPPLATSAPPAP